MSETATTDNRAPRRVRHEIRLRRLTVRSAERLTPHMIRVTLEGPDLAGFSSPGFDDHVKLFFLLPGQDESSLPRPGPEGVVFADGAPRPAMRDYTPRRHDAAAGTLTIDFALHDAGPATRWAEQAAPGQPLFVAGPRGSFLLPTGFDWHLLLGDATALPAIARRLEELPAGARALVFAEVDGPEDELAFETQADLRVVWVHRNGGAPGQPDRLAAAIAATPFPAGDFHAWVGCESLSAKALRRLLLETKGADPRWIKAAGYWKHGAAGVHEQHTD